MVEDARARLYKRRYGIKLVIVDYLRLVQAPGKDTRIQVGHVADALRQLAKSEQLGVVLLSQLRRPAGGLNQPPTMLDLKESGDIEAHAHVVLLPTLHGLGMIARTGLSEREMRLVSELTRPILARPFETLRAQFEEAWERCAPGAALDYLATKHTYSSLQFGVPLGLTIPLQYISNETTTVLKAAVRSYFGSILDEQMLRLVRELEYSAQVPQEEISRLKAA